MFWRAHHKLNPFLGRNSKAREIRQQPLPRPHGAAGSRFPYTVLPRSQEKNASLGTETPHRAACLLTPGPISPALKWAPDYREMLKPRWRCLLVGERGTEESAFKGCDRSKNASAHPRQIRTVSSIFLQDFKNLACKSRKFASPEVRWFSLGGEDNACLNTD